MASCSNGYLAASSCMNADSQDRAGDPGDVAASDELGVDASQILDLHRRMLRIRRFEERVADLYRDGEIPGFVHLSIGQEASAVGACWWLDDGDVITSTHRGHGHCLAKGLRPPEMFAELFGRESGVCRGRGGSMHIADPMRGIFGANGIVAAGLPIAVGAAFAAKARGRGVVVAFFGDGASAQGAFHESLNLASLWKLPIAFFCENNHYAEFSPDRMQQAAPLAQRAQGYGIPYVEVHGNDVAAVVRGMSSVIAQLREGAGPCLVEADTYRWRGHYEGDPERYRDAAEVAEWKARDPLSLSRRQFLSLGGTESALAGVESECTEEIEGAVDEARQGPHTDPDDLLDFVTAPRQEMAEPPDPDPSGEAYRVMDAIRSALAVELEADPAVFLAGVDVGAGGNIFGLTRGLFEKWPDRVRDTPISESAIVGLAIGSAMAGMRPVVEIMYMDFIGVCFDQLLNQAAKLRFMTGGHAQLALTIRTQFGAGRSSGSQHSQSLEALLAHIPGLTVVMPSTPADTYGLLRAAIRDPNPVVFVEHRLLYSLKGPRPARDHIIPIGKAAIRRRGSDITVVSMSRMVHVALAAAERAATEGIDCEVVDLRTVVPLDRATILASLAKTGRILCVQEAVTDFGIGAELAAMAANEGFWSLDAPVVRIGAKATPAPYSPELERRWLPSEDDVLTEMRKLAAF
jgi:2-oxoisovalerate dehydrogenase E1 component